MEINVKLNFESIKFMIFYRTQETLLSVNEKSERGEIAFELLEDRTSFKSDLLILGEKLMFELERDTEAHSKLLDSSLKKVSIIFDKNFTNNIETCCLFEIPEINISRNNSLPFESNSKEDAKIVLSLRDVEGSLKDLDEASFSTNPYTIVLDNERSENQTFIKNFSRQRTAKFTDRTPIKDKEIINLNASKLESIKDRIGTSLEKGVEEDTPLLNFEWADLNHETPQLIETSFQIKNEQQRPIKKSNHHKRSSTQVCYSEILQEFQVDEKLDSTNNLGRSSVPQERASQANASSFLNVPIDARHSRKLAFSGKKSLSRANSPWTGNDERMSKSPSSKKKAIKVSDKFEPIINGIQQNNIDTADLTTAGN